VAKVKRDIREGYLEQLKYILIYDHRSFITFLDCAMNILENPEEGQPENPEIAEIEEMVERFCWQFRSEKGVPSLYKVLYNLDCAMSRRNKWVQVKTSRTRRKILYSEVEEEFNTMLGDIKAMIRKRSKSIRLSTVTLMP
jgi:hypothetical protein